MYTNEGLSAICKKLSKGKSINPMRDELSKLLCPYAGIEELQIEPRLKEVLVDGIKLFHEESLQSGKPLLGLFGEWLGNEAFREKCLSDPELIKKGSALFEVYPHACVEVPALQLIYEYVDWYSNVPESIIDMAYSTATRNVGFRLEEIYKKS